MGSFVLSSEIPTCHLHKLLPSIVDRRALAKPLTRCKISSTNHVNHRAFAVAQRPHRPATVTFAIRESKHRDSDLLEQQQSAGWNIDMENNPSPSRVDRKFIERNRRNQMKALFRKLNSLVPHQRSKESISLPDQLEEATNYIKKLQINVEKMKDKKDMLLGIERSNARMNGGKNGLKSPRIEIQQMGSALEVILITGLDSQFMFSETIRVLHEEGVDVVNASYKVIGDAVFHSIHCQDGESANGAARISERLKNFIHDSSYSAI
ncbi:Transcription factor bHLH36 [Spatholobus suberectus]|nr:Transcription factor bHLH36 [Spatholobus suberectus]